MIQVPLLVLIGLGGAFVALLALSIWLLRALATVQQLVKEEKEGKGMHETIYQEDDEVIKDLVNAILAGVIDRSTL